MKMLDIIDVYRVCGEYKIEWKRVNSDTLEISDADYQKLLDSVANKRYIERLRRSSGRFCGGAFTIS